MFLIPLLSQKSYLFYCEEFSVHDSNYLFANPYRIHRTNKRAPGQTLTFSHNSAQRLSTFSPAQQVHSRCSLTRFPNSVRFDITHARASIRRIIQRRQERAGGVISAASSGIIRQTPPEGFPERERRRATCSSSNGKAWSGRERDKWKCERKLSSRAIHVDDVIREMWPTDCVCGWGRRNAMLLAGWDLSGSTELVAREIFGSTWWLLMID